RAPEPRRIWSRRLQTSDRPRSIAGQEQGVATLTEPRLAPTNVATCTDIGDRQARKSPGGEAGALNVARPQHLNTSFVAPARHLWNTCAWNRPEYKYVRDVTTRRNFSRRRTRRIIFCLATSIL